MHRAKGRGSRKPSSLSHPPLVKPHKAIPFHLTAEGNHQRKPPSVTTKQALPKTNPSFTLSARERSQQWAELQVVVQEASSGAGKPSQGGAWPAEAAGRESEAGGTESRWSKHREIRDEEVRRRKRIGEKKLKQEDEARGFASIEWGK